MIAISWGWIRFSPQSTLHSLQTKTESLKTKSDSFLCLQYNISMLTLSAGPGGLIIVFTFQVPWLIILLLFIRSPLCVWNFEPYHISTRSLLFACSVHLLFALLVIIFVLLDWQLVCNFPSSVPLSLLFFSKAFSVSTSYFLHCGPAAVKLELWFEQLVEWNLIQICCGYAWVART